MCSPDCSWFNVLISAPPSCNKQGCYSPICHVLIVVRSYIIAARPASVQHGCSLQIACCGSSSVCVCAGNQCGVGPNLCSLQSEGMDCMPHDTKPRLKNDHQPPPERPTIVKGTCPQVLLGSQGYDHRAMNISLHGPLSPGLLAGCFFRPQLQKTCLSRTCFSQTRLPQTGSPWTPQNIPRTPPDA